jgi:hypothetical protein
MRSWANLLEAQLYTQCADPIEAGWLAFEAIDGWSCFNQKSSSITERLTLCPSSASTTSSSDAWLRENGAKDEASAALRPREGKIHAIALILCIFVSP